MDEDIGWLVPPTTPGRIAMLPLPGLVIFRRGERGIDPDRRHRTLDRLATGGVARLFCLLTDAECEPDDLADLAQAAAERSIAFSRWPIADFEEPGPEFDWRGLAGLVDAEWRRGRGIGLCCLAGYGRSGMMAARLLIAAGTEPSIAVARVRAVRPGAIESDLQLAYLLGSKP